MTTEEIVAALRNCASIDGSGCAGCDDTELDNGTLNCADNLKILAADLIENQQRHIETLMQARGERMKVYLAGKITGDPNYREKFAAAAKKLEERAGVTVISPAVTPEGLKKADYMRICFAMLESADTAVFLPDWEDSPGAQLEKHWCEYVGKKMVFLMEE